MHQRATQTNPGLMAIKGVGPVTGAQLLITATALDVWPARVGEIELGRRRDDNFAHRSRQWLTAA
jgi:hypothetical protein